MKFSYMFHGEDALDILLWMDEHTPSWTFADSRRTDYVCSYKEHVRKYFQMIKHPRGRFNHIIHIQDKDEALLFKLTWGGK